MAQAFGQTPTEASIRLEDSVRHYLSMAGRLVDPPLVLSLQFQDLVKWHTYKDSVVIYHYGIHLMYMLMF